MSIIDDVEAAIRNKSGMTELQIAEELGKPRQQSVNQQCRALVKEKRVFRHGRGGAGDPFRYHLEPEVAHA